MSKAMELIFAEQWFQEVLSNELNALNAEHFAARLAAQKRLTEQYNAKVKMITEKYAPVNTPPRPWATERVEMATKVLDAENQAAAAELDKQTRRTYAQWFVKWCDEQMIDFKRFKANDGDFNEFDQAVKEGWRPS